WSRSSRHPPSRSSGYTTDQDVRSLVGPPLVSHCGCNTGVGSASFSPTFRAWRHFMYSVNTPINNICWSKNWKILKPKTCSFSLTMPKLPWLDDLVRLANSGTDNADWILQSNLGDRGV